MNKNHWEILGFWSIALLIMIATMIIIRWVVSFVTWSTLDSGWAQAIGSVGAILVAVWVAHRDTRLRREEANVVARIAAAAIIHEARIMSAGASDARTILQASIVLGYPASEINFALPFVDTQRWWSVDELGRLAPLPNGCAVHLAEAQSFIRDAVALMHAGVMRSAQQNPFAEVAESIEPAIEALAKATVLLGFATVQLSNIIQPVDN